MPVRRLSTAAGNCIDSSPSAVFLAAAGSIPAAWSRRLRYFLPIGWPWIELGNTNSRSSAAPPIRRTRRSATAARAAAIGELHPERTVLADAPTSSRGGGIATLSALNTKRIGRRGRSKNSVKPAHTTANRTPAPKPEPLNFLTLTQPRHRRPRMADPGQWQLHTHYPCCTERLCFRRSSRNHARPASDRS